jgi:hypothetical protein
MAVKTWEMVSRVFMFALMAASLASLLASAAQAGTTEETLAADVPFAFNIGNRTFTPGHYQFVFTGDGVLVLRDAHAHALAAIATRPIETGAPAAASKLVFHGQNKQPYLAQIWIEKHARGLEVLGQNPSSQRSSTNSALPPYRGMFDSPAAPALKH